MNCLRGSSIAGLALCVACLGPSLLSAQSEGAPGSSLPVLIEGNDHFGIKMLQELSRERPGKNVVLAPLPLTLMLAAIQNGTSLDKTNEEIGGAFGWGTYARLAVPSRMLLGAFQKPDERFVTWKAHRWKGTRNPPGTESAWISNTIAFKPDKSGHNPFSAEFVLASEDYFGIRFRPVSDLDPQLVAARAKGDSRINVVFDSRMHVQMVWAGNTFSISKPFNGDFHPTSGDVKQVEMQTSEFEEYPHVKTDLYEAAVLPCFSGSVTFVLPGAGKSVAEVEAAILSDPSQLDNLPAKQPGSVTMPTIHLKDEANLRPALEAMGINEMFVDLGKVATAKAYVESVSQELDFEMNRDGIRGDSETTMGIVAGGIMVGPEPFLLKLDRPFLFLIRDWNSGAMTYLGVVEDPSEP